MSLIISDNYFYYGNINYAEGERKKDHPSKYCYILL